MTDDDLEYELFSRIDSAIRNDEPVRGVLFHGTGEPIVGPLKPGDYDKVLWTSTSAAIAQTYIPRSGVSVYLNRPDSWRENDRIRPQMHSAWYELAKQVSGQDCFDITMRNGEVESWRVPSDWPTYGECWAFVTSQNGLGYPSKDVIEIFTAHSDTGWTHLPSSYKLQGQLFMTLGDPNDFRDLRRSPEPDLMEVEYHQTDLFKQAWDRGVFGVKINDFAQTKIWGNVGHESFGLGPKSAEQTKWLTIPATNYEPETMKDFNAITPEVRKWHEEMAQKYEAVPLAM
jgi:hypothetical protein